MTDDNAAAHNIRISYSSSNTFQGCKRRFYYEKVVKVDHDPDYSDNAKALRIGKCFHELLELCKHDFNNVTKEMINTALDNNKVDDPTEQGLVLGMAKKYSILHRKSGFYVVGIEVEIGDRTNYIGFVDAVLMDNAGYWWITDLKTAAKLSNSLLARLAKDPQLNIYSHYVDQIAEILKLDVDKFAGVRYRVTTKATIKRSVKETMGAFVGRIFDRVEAFDIGIPAADLKPKETYDRFMKMLDQMRALRDTPEDEIPQSFAYCESFFKPCPYWSNCYGSTFTSAGDKYEIFDSTNIPELSAIDDLDLL